MVAKKQMHMMLTYTVFSCGQHACGRMHMLTCSCIQQMRRVQASIPSYTHSTG